MAALVCIDGPARGALFPLPGPAVRIGRGEACPIRLRDERLSREHAEVELSDGGWRIRDLASTNGVTKNGLPVGDALLRPGDEIAMGGSVFLFTDDAGPTGASTGAAGRPTVAADAAPVRLEPGPTPRLPAVRFSPMIGRSASMVEVYGLVSRAAACDLPVIVLGESGTGKELVARAIHAFSPRRDEPFVPVNCANLTGALLESELFGHEKGAFTGAYERRMGRFEAAGEGTIFLDEVGEMEPGLQARLLRVLAENEFTRVGGHVPFRSLARVVAATNRDLTRAIREGRFREDLYFRLRVLPIDLPPLRARREDVPLLLDHCLERCRAQSGTRLAGFDEAAREALAAYAWPGNVRELQNLVERLAILCPREVAGFADLPVEIRAPGAPPDVEGEPIRTLAEVERLHLLRALAGAGGNKTLAAGILGIERSTLYSKLKRHGLDAAGPVGEE
ncbi:MAG: sigma 54-interacting transcriptional regulator [Planctomycetes bacterium]|nr:sigma 54-interacting transcriptional regulator [Planctomycetota bacterium]